MLESFIIFLHLCVLCMGSERIGYDFYPELDGWLKVHTEQTDWRTARINCHNEEALLASPWSAEFSSTVNKLQTTKYPSLPVLYSGAGIRADSTGIPMEACNKKRCRVFHADGTMDKVHCSQKLPYACFAPKLSCGGGYELFTQNGQCYKFHTTEYKTVADAKIICGSEGAYLAKINDDREREFLESRSTFLTFVDNDNGGPEYRHVTRSGTSDYKCNDEHNFICEKYGILIPSDLRD